MRFCTSLAMMLICVGVSFTACDMKGGSDDNSQARVPAPESLPPIPQTSPSDGVRRITISELRGALEKGEAVVVDVRGGVEYKLGHIRDARSMPLGLIAKRADELPRDKLIVTYCA